MRLSKLMPAAATLSLLLAACAAKPPASQPDDLADYNQRNDPFEPTNRTFYRINNALDRYVLRPVAREYVDVVPGGVRGGVHNTLSNLGNPAQFANDVMQGHPHKAGNTLMRLLINSTAGVGGVFDVASGWGFPDHSNDFGLTLAVWGVPSGPFLFLPVLGPSDPRDGIGYGANSALDPLTWASFGGSSTLGLSRFGVGAVDSRSRVLDVTDSIEKTALDPYATFRSLYQQNRASDVEGARADLPATVPAWFPARAPAPTPGNQTSPPVVAPKVAPSPSVTP